jgi:hypothetical protein
VGSKGEFREFVLGLMPSLKLSAESVTAESIHHLKVIAQPIERAAGSVVLLEAMQHIRKIGVHPLASLKADMDGKGASEGVFVSTAGFTAEAREYAAKNGITLFAPEDLRREAEPGDARLRHNIYERVFASSMDEGQATRYFEQRRRKTLFGLIGPGERVDSITCRFVPVASFRLKKAENTAGSKGENTFHVNLNTGDLYYIYRGISGKEAVLRSTSILRRLMDLNQNSIRVLSAMVENEEILFDRAAPGLLAFLQENAGNVALLESLGLISARKDGKGYLSNVNLPRFTSPRFSISDFLAVGGPIESGHPADDMTYQPRVIVTLLPDFFGAAGEFTGVTYLPYYTCRYVGGEGRVRIEIREDTRQNA